MLKKSLYKLFAIILLLFRWPKGTHNFLLGSLSYLFRSLRVWGLPISVTIEIASVCNAKCPLCETGTNELQRPKRLMEIKKFKQIADQISPFANTIMLYFMGETFLNPNVYEMIHYLKKKRLFVTACTNGDLIDPESLVKSGMDEIGFQISGISQESHGLYRKNSNLERVLANIKEVIRVKKKMGSDVPKVNMGFIVMRHNEDEIPAFFQLAEQLSVDHAEVVNTGVRTHKQAVEYLPTDLKYWNYSLEAYKRGELKPSIQLNNECSWIYYSTVITVDGDVLPCCRDPKAQYVMGNVFDKPFDEIWNNEKYRAFRQKILTNQRKCHLCDLCWGFGVPLPRTISKFRDTSCSIS